LRLLRLLRLLHLLHLLRLLRPEYPEGLLRPEYPEDRLRPWLPHHCLWLMSGSSKLHDWLNRCCNLNMTFVIMTYFYLNNFQVKWNWI
jgi:hypothetical protein